MSLLSFARVVAAPGLAMAPAAILFAFTSAPACALDIPQPGPKDARVRTVDYDPAQVVRLAAQPRIAIQVVFAADEAIRHVALGDPNAWQTAADGNVLFLKPKERSAATNLIVTTDRAGSARSYVFELISAPAASTRRALRENIYAVRFRYPADTVAKARAAVETAAAAAAQQVSRVQVEAAALEGPRNLAYQLQGPATLQPAEVSDNGRFTVLRFPGGQVLPAIYTVGFDGTETLASFDVRGEFVVVHGVAPGLRLRLGRQLLCITNGAYRPQGSPSLTASPDVARTEQGSAQ
jgi:type IV secretion system protein VirB9